jgi:hypothetical protein
VQLQSTQETEHLSVAVHGSGARVGIYFVSRALVSPAQAALGPGGTEGGFRQAACATLAALRGSADTMTVSCQDCRERRDQQGTSVTTLCVQAT